MTTVSVIITCFNEGPYIGAALRSVLEQTRADAVCEVLIGDAGSDAETLAVLEEARGWDPRIQVYGGERVGIARNRNQLVARASGELVAFLDGDDYWTPDKLERQLPLFDRPEVTLAYAGFSLFPDGEPEARRDIGLRRLPDRPNLPVAFFLHDPPIVPSTLIMRRSAFESLGGFDETLAVFEDTEFYLRAAEMGGFAAVDLPLLMKRERTTSITGGRTAELMAYHAFVAFQFAARRPEAAPLINRRLSERAAKLGNVSYRRGALSEARRYYRLASALRPLNPAPRLGWLLARLGDGPVRRLVLKAVGWDRSEGR